MSDASMPDRTALDRVAGTADMLLRAASGLADPERDLVSLHLGERSEVFRRAYRWTRLLGLAFVAGPLLVLGALVIGFSGTPEWVSTVYVNAAVVIVGIPAIQVYRVARRALDVAVGAYVVASEGSPP